MRSVSSILMDSGMLIRSSKPGGQKELDTGGYVDYRLGSDCPFGWIVADLRGNIFQFRLFS